MSIVNKSPAAKVFQNVQQKALLKGVALDLFRIVCDHPGMTVGEISLEYQKLSPDKPRARNELAKRINELYQWGALVPAGSILCSVTGRRASRWKITGKEPSRDALAGFKASKRAAATLELAPVQTPAQPTTTQPAASITDIVAERHRRTFRDLAVRCRLILRFRFFMSKSYAHKVRQVLEACEYAAKQ